jgi:hypothetical protein
VLVHVHVHVTEDTNSELVGQSGGKVLDQKQGKYDCTSVLTNEKRHYHDRAGIVQEKQMRDGLGFSPTPYSVS